jgi:hypothetical protein
MKGTPAIYLGKIVDKKHFRTFIYGTNGERKLVNSWDEYQVAMQSGLWFATVEDVAAVKAIADESVEKEVTEQAVEAEKPKAAKPKPVRSTVNSKEPPQVAAKIVEDKTVFEVTDENR